MSSQRVKPYVHWACWASRIPAVNVLVLRCNHRISTHSQLLLPVHTQPAQQSPRMDWHTWVTRHGWRGQTEYERQQLLEWFGATPENPEPGPEGVCVCALLLLCVLCPLLLTHTFIDVLLELLGARMRRVLLSAAHARVLHACSC